MAKDMPPITGRAYCGGSNLFWELAHISARICGRQSSRRGKGKPRDLDYPACWTGARKCGAEIWRAALSASPPKCKNGATAGFELPHMSLLRLMRLYPLDRRFH